MAKCLHEMTYFFTILFFFFSLFCFVFIFVGVGLKWDPLVNDWSARIKLLKCEVSETWFVVSIPACLPVTMCRGHFKRDCVLLGKSFWTS